MFANILYRPALAIVISVIIVFLGMLAGAVVWLKASAEVRCATAKAAAIASGTTTR